MVGGNINVTATAQSTDGDWGGEPSCQGQSSFFFDTRAAELRAI